GVSWPSIVPFKFSFCMFQNRLGATNSKGRSVPYLKSRVFSRIMRKNGYSREFFLFVGSLQSVSIPKQPHAKRRRSIQIRCDGQGLISLDCEGFEAIVLVFSWRSWRLCVSLHQISA